MASRRLALAPAPSRTLHSPADPAPQRRGTPHTGAVSEAPLRRVGWLGARYRPALLAAACGLVALGAGALFPVDPKMGIAVLLGAATVVVVLVRPIVGGLLLVGLVPATSGFASGFPVAHVRISEALVGAVGVTLIAFVRRHDAVPWQALDWVLLAYGMCWAAMGVVAAKSLGQHLSLEQWGTVFGQLQFFLIYRGVRIAVRTAEERRMAIWALVVAGVPVALLAVLQETKAPGIASLLARLTGGLTGGSVGTGTSGPLIRVTGPFVNWAALAGFLLPVVLVVVALAVSGVPLARRPWFVGAGVLAAVALALTLEQSAILCVLVGVVVLVARCEQRARLMRWVVAGLVVVALVAGPFLVARLFQELGGGAGTGRVGWVPQTLGFRWGVWTRQYLPAIGARPLTGYGVVLPSSIHWAWPESQYISFLMEGGVPMLAMFAVLAWSMLDGARAAARSPDAVRRALGLASVITVVAMVVMNATWPFLSNGGMPQALWALMALAVPDTLGDRARAAAPGWELLHPAPGPSSSARVLT